MIIVNIHIIEKRVDKHYEFCNLLQHRSDVDSYIKTMSKLHSSYFLELDEEHLQIHKFLNHQLDCSSTTLRVTQYCVEVSEACDL